MMNMNEPTSDERETTRQSTEPAVVMTTFRGKAESSEEPTVYVNDLDVFVSMMLLEDSVAVLSVGLLDEHAVLLSTSVRFYSSTGRAGRHACNC